MRANAVAIKTIDIEAIFFHNLRSPPSHSSQISAPFTK